MYVFNRKRGNRLHRERLILEFQAPLGVGLATHLEFYDTAFSQLLVSEVKAAEGLAVEFDAADVAVAVAHLRSLDYDMSAVGQGDVGIGQIGCAEDILIGARAYGIETEGREDEPGRHLATVVVAAEAAYVVAVHAIHNRAQPQLRLPRLRRPCVEIRYVMAGFIAVDITTYEAIVGDIFVVSVILLGQVHREELVKTLAEDFLAAYHSHQPIDVMRDMEREIPRVALNETFAIGLQRVHRCLEAAVGIARCCEACGRIECVTVVACPSLELVGHASVAQRPCCGSHGKIVVGILQRIRGCRGVAVKGCIALFHISLETWETRPSGGSLERSKHSIALQLRSLNNSIGHGTYGVVACHTPALVTHQAPYG